jgi:alanine racemase
MSGQSDDGRGEEQFRTPLAGYRPTWADIDPAAFARNVDAVRRRLPEGARLMAVLKANGYGHGAVELARTCTPDRVTMIGLALLEEALELRRNGITLPILVFGPTKAIEVALEHDITLGVTGPEQLAVVCEIAEQRDVAIHLKLDSGMGRMGVVESELDDVIAMIRATPRLTIEGLYTHFANADEPRDDYTKTQILNFDRMVDKLRAAGITAPLQHLANSAATLRGLVRKGDMARVGIALYGPGDIEGFEPVMRWRTEIVRLKTLPPGSPVGYGTTFRTKRESRIATLPVGYADGYHRLLSNNSDVAIRGIRAPIVGRVSMDLVTIDVTDVNAEVGDEVELLGGTISAAELASKANTISYEIFCSVSARVPRRYAARNTQ